MTCAESLWPASYQHRAEEETAPLYKSTNNPGSCVQLDEGEHLWV